jgi:hypothetical protein
VIGPNPMFHVKQCGHGPMNGLGVIYVAGSRRDPRRDEANGSGFDMTAQRQKR